jgi:hypothetical protein
VLETKYDSLRGCWFSKEVIKPFGVGVSKSIKRWWKIFSEFVIFEVGDGSKFSFGMMCGMGNNIEYILSRFV